MLRNFHTTVDVLAFTLCYEYMIGYIQRSTFDAGPDLSTLTRADRSTPRHRQTQYFPTVSKYVDPNNS